ncbi:hypothetical protein DSO57_1023798 [Entomophthora muscae]|uniref:Uncharacterized protein n=1 Tax=Entomophthora muscae TaxID=34485 RepID=A0ACC2SRN5_9FUNG|nr:hypothetical protein DSO57_1023798 [Entomophthora muscae]
MILRDQIRVNYKDTLMNIWANINTTRKYNNTKKSLTLDAADEDGFVKVVKGRSTNTSGDGATVRAMTKAAAKQLSMKISNERREQELLGEDKIMHFYKLQAHETKRTRLARLRQEFEQDRQRIAEMKRQRLEKSNKV